MRTLRGQARLPALAASKGGFLTPEGSPLPIDPGLLERFLVAERGVEWRPVERPPIPAKSRSRRPTRTGARTRTENGSRLAYYHDETARIEQRSTGSKTVLTVTSGPVGALVIVGECHRKGLPTTLEARSAADTPGFPEGAIEATWNAHARTRRHALPFADVVTLARYALA